MKTLREMIDIVEGQKEPLAQVGDTVVYHDFTGFKQKKSVVVSIHKRDWGYQYHLKNDDILDDLSFEEPGGAEVIHNELEEEITPEAIEKVESLYKDNK